MRIWNERHFQRKMGELWRMSYQEYFVLIMLFLSFPRFLISPANFLCIQCGYINNIKLSCNMKLLYQFKLFKRKILFSHAPLNNNCKYYKLEGFKLKLSYIANPTFCIWHTSLQMRRHKLSNFPKKFVHFKWTVELKRKWSASKQVESRNLDCNRTKKTLVFRPTSSSSPSENENQPLHGCCHQNVRFSSHSVSPPHCCGSPCLKTY